MNLGSRAGVSAVPSAISLLLPCRVLMERGGLRRVADSNIGARRLNPRPSSGVETVS